jgi:hypothetical protein
MAINKAGGVSAVTVDELLRQGLRIPNYQRAYSWEVSTALQLVDDVSEALRDTEREDVPYVLGAIILHKEGEHLNVVDGQQRLLTLRMILAALDPVNYPISVSGNGDSPVALVWVALQKRLSQLEDKAEFLEFVYHRCQLVRIVTDDIDEAFRVFDSQNYRGKPLAPHDLLKAHHLREMRDESAAMKVAVVEAWESVKDEDLDRLFSTFLYRISKWSRGESALEFAIRDIGMFKGISSRSHSSFSPNQRYHLAAQAAMPLLSAWATFSTHDARDAGRSRFQLDAPMIAGRSFFEMVTFMLDELKMLEKEVIDSGFKDFGPSQSRYRYVYELFIAALLCYTNKFGDEEVNEARNRLFAWAYALRIELLRVHFASADNRARGKSDANKSAFVLLRNAMTGSVVRKLPTASRPYNDNHEKELVAFIEALQ